MEKVKDNVYRLTPQEWEMIKKQGAILEIPVRDKEIWFRKERTKRSLMIKPRLY